MRSSALAGFIASAVLVSGSAGFASTFLVGPYLGDHVRHQSPRASLMSSAAPMDPLAVIQTSAATKTALDGEPIESQPAHRLRPVENTTAPAPATTATPTTVAPSAKPVIATASTDMPGPISEDAFTRTSAASAMPIASGGPLIATEATSTMVAAKLEDGEPVLTLRIAPVLTPAATAVETADPDNAVEPTVMSAPPAEQALATSTVAAVTPTPAAEPVAPPPAEPVARPRTKPALQAPEPAPEPVRRVKPRPTPARVTTTAAPAHASHESEEPAAPPQADPLNAPYMPSTSPLSNEQPSTAPATAAPASMAPPPSSGGPTPLVMPQ